MGARHVVHIRQNIQEGGQSMSFFKRAVWSSLLICGSLYAQTQHKLNIPDITELVNTKMQKMHKTEKTDSVIAKKVSNDFSEAFHITKVAKDGGMLIVTDANGSCNVFSMGKTMVVGEYRQDSDGNFVWSKRSTVDFNGFIASLALYKHYVFVGKFLGDKSIEVYDLSEPEKPKKCGFYNTVEEAAGIRVESHYAYINNDNNHKIEILDIADACSPRKISEISIDDDTFGSFDIRNNLLLVTTSKKNLISYDVSDKSHPVKSESLNIDTDYTLRVVISGDKAYVMQESSTFAVFDISDPEDMKKLAEYDMGDGYRIGSIQGKNEYIYVSAYNTDDLKSMGIYVYSLEENDDSGDDSGDDEGPYVQENTKRQVTLEVKEVAKYIFNDYSSMLVIKDNLLFVPGAFLGMRVFEIANSGTLHQLYHEKTFGAFSIDMTIRNGYAYIADLFTGLQIVKINPREHLQLAWANSDADTVGSFFVSARDEKVLVSTIKGSVLYNVEDKTAPNQVSRISENSFTNSMLIDGYALVVKSKTLEIYDLSEPDNPAKVGSYTSSKDIYYYVSDGNYVYLTEKDRLEIIDIRDKTAPSQTATLIIDNSIINAIKKKGEYVYLSSYGTNEFFIVDVHDKSTPILKKRIKGYAVYKFDVISHYGIMVTLNEEEYHSTLFVIDFNGDDNKVLAQYDKLLFVTSVTSDGQYVYLTDYLNGIHVLNVPIPFMEPIVNYLLF
jgi:hypothetical protein